MKLYTSYWAQIRNFPPNLVGLNTTVWPPKWRPLGKDKNNVLVIDCPPLKPGSECEGLCRGACDPKHPKDCQFLKVYRHQLDYINIEDFMAQLEWLKQQIEKGENLQNVEFAFIVFESPKNPCSERWAVQEWLKYNGIEVEEWHK